MKTLLRHALPLIAAALAAPALAGERAKADGPCEVRVYLLDKNHQPASLSGVSAVLVTEDPAGREKRIPLTIVTSQGNSPRAPHCALRSEAIRGTTLEAAFCALGGDGRIRREPDRDEPGGPGGGEGGRALEDQDGAARAVVDIDVPYFKAELPADHLCGPGCRMSIRFMIAGNYHSTRSFSCAARWKSDLPTCCLHHQLVAECAELKRHLGANEKAVAQADLDRLACGLQRPDARAKDEADRQSCLDQIDRIRSALSSGNAPEASAAAETLRDRCEACFTSCSGTEN